MADDFMKKYWQNREKEIQRGHSVSSITSPTFTQTPPANRTGSELLAGYSPQTQPEFLTLSPDRFINRQNSGSTQGGSSAPKVVNLKEGDQYYCQVQTGGYGTADNLAIVGGIVGGATSKNVYVKGERTFYLLGDKVNDLGKVNEGQRICLVQVEVPFVGTFFVKKESIVQSFGSNSGKQLLRG